MTTANIAALIGSAICYAANDSSIVEGSAPERNFTLLSIEREGKRDGLDFIVAKVIDHDDGDAEKFRTLHLDGIYA